MNMCCVEKLKFRKRENVQYTWFVVDIVFDAAAAGIMRFGVLCCGVMVCSNFEDPFTGVFELPFLRPTVLYTWHASNPTQPPPKFIFCTVPLIAFHSCDLNLFRYRCLPACLPVCLYCTRIR